ncbi:zinc finger BED domain-containing protein 5-like isoform X1 [Antennarius striatus]|uniref:zinc finger BED domain-containing protein 5-like isoform X1 n=1 Tax=Antennarius striatus TaxID=241820 RepID=UPI0035B39511
MRRKAGPNKCERNYYFRKEWEEAFFFTMTFSKCVCLICRSTISTPTRGNVERHYRTVHRDCDTEFPLESELRKRKVQELKCQMSEEESFFLQPISKAKAATEASVRMSRFIFKNNGSFRFRETVKEAFVGAADSLFRDFENKDDILSSIKALQQSTSAFPGRREAEDLNQQLWEDISDCECFSLQVDEPADGRDMGQVYVYIRLVFTDITAKEELLTVLTVKEQTRGEDIFKLFKNFMEKTQLPVHKLVSITTDEAPVMSGRLNGFITKCRQDDAFPNFLNYSMFHHQALCLKMLNMKEIMDVAVKITGSVGARSLQKQLFREHLEKADLDLSGLLLQPDVRCFSRGIFLQRFRDLCPEIKEFFRETGHAEYKQLSDGQWLLDLAFLTDLTNMLNDFNLELQGKNKKVIDMIRSVNVFKGKIQHLSSNLQEHDLENFQNLRSELEMREKTCVEVDISRYIQQIDNYLSEFDKCFQDFSLLEPVAAFMCNPFQEDVEVDSLVSKIEALFHLNSSGVKDDILTLQDDAQLKSRAHGQFWKLLTEEKYPNMRKCATSLTALFSSTYLWEASMDPDNPDYVPSVFPRSEPAPSRKKRRKSLFGYRKKLKANVQEEMTPLKECSLVESQTSLSPSVSKDEETLTEGFQPEPEANTVDSETSISLSKPSPSSKEPSNLLNQCKIPLLCLRSVFVPECGYKCDQCNQVFILASQLVKHLQLHEKEEAGEKVIMCERCGTLFTNQADFSQHKHPEEPSFPCNICDRSFATIQNLKRHKLLHVKDGRKCGKCGVLFCQLHNHILFQPQPESEQECPDTQSSLESDSSNSTDSDDENETNEPLQTVIVQPALPSPPKPFPKTHNPLPPPSHTKIISEIPIPKRINEFLPPPPMVPKYSRNNFPAGFGHPDLPRSLKMFSPGYLTSAFLEVHRNYEYIFNKSIVDKNEVIVKKDPSVEFKKEENYRIAYDVEIVL